MAQFKSTSRPKAEFQNCEKLQNQSRRCQTTTRARAREGEEEESQRKGRSFLSFHRLLRRNPFIRAREHFAVTATCPSTSITVEIDSNTYTQQEQHYLTIQRSHCVITNHGCPQILQMDERAVSGDLTADRREPDSRVRLPLFGYERHHTQLYA